MFWNKWYYFTLLLSVISNIMLLLWKGKMFVFKTVALILKLSIAMLALYSFLLNVFAMRFSKIVFYCFLTFTET